MPLEHQVIPLEDRRCVWMTAGIISYYLCDRDFECENCQLDLAMHKAVPNHEQSSPAHSEGGLPAPGLRAGFLYGRNHCWLKPLGARLLRVGLEPGLSAALVALKAVVLPSPGETLRKGQSCLWIVLECGTFAIGAPCDGIVCGRNSRLGEEPHLLRFQPFDDGWLFELETEVPSPEDRDFMDAEKAETFYREDTARFMRSLGITAKSNHRLPTGSR